MTNSKSTKRALLTAVLAVLMCVSMLIGTTFAWFTDTASTAVNKIQAGTLDVALEMATAWDSTGKPIAWESAENKTLSFRKAATASDNVQILWEPGCEYKLPELRIKNAGNLALKFKVVVTGITGDAKLNEAINWYYNCYAFDDEYGFSYGSQGEQWANISDSELSIGDAAELRAAQEESGIPAYAGDPVISIKGHMREDVGNEYQGLSIEGVAITVVATQATVENDSYNNQYDADAAYPDGTVVAAGVMQSADGNTYKISNATGLKWFADQVNNKGNRFVNKTVELTSDIDLAGIAWTPIGNDGGAIFTGTFNGNGYTIKNLKVTDSRTTADEGTTAKQQGVGFFGWLNGYVDNVKFENANVIGYHNVGVLAGYQQFGQIKNVTVENSVVTGTHIGNNLCGDKVGGMVGVSYNVNYNDATNTYVDMINCKIKNTAVKGGRDTGKIAGAAVEFVGKFAGCEATGVTLGSTENCTGANIGACLGQLVGRDI